MSGRQLDLPSEYATSRPWIHTGLDESAGSLVRLVRYLQGEPPSRSSSRNWLPRCSPALVVLVVVAVLTGLAAAPGVGSAFEFASVTVASTSAKAFAPSAATPRPYHAYQAFETDFPRWLAENNEVFLIRGADIISNYSQALCAELITRMTAVALPGAAALIGTSSYYSRLAEDLPEVAAGYVTANTSANGSMLILVQVDTTDAAAATALVSAGIDLGDELSGDATYGGLSVILTGRLTTAVLDKKATGLGFALGDGIGLPFIVLLLLYRLGSCRLLLIPACALCASLILSYAVGRGLCSVLNVPEFQPNIMLFLCLAFSVDYSFFLLTRFQEERLEHGKEMEAAVVAMLEHSGAVVSVSGSLLVLTWLALGFFPVDGLNAIGFCSAAAVLLCMVCNLVLAPCMLLTFADTFSHTRGCCGGDGGCCSTCKTSSRHLGGLPTLSDLDIDSNAPLMRVVATERWKNGHHRLAASLTRFPYNLISLAVVYACFAWGSSALAHLSLSLGVQFAPADTAAAHAFASVQSTSPFDQSGVFASPFAILAHNVSGATSLASAALAGVGFEGGDEGGGIEGGGIEGTTSLFTQSYFGATCALARSLAEVPGVVPTSLQGIAFRALGGAVECLRAADAIELVGVMDASYLYTLRQLTNVASAADRPLNASDYFAATASVLTFAPSFYPFSTRSVALVDDVYDALDTAESEPASGGLSLSVFHPIVAEVAAEQYTTARLPWVLAVTLGLCFLIIALFFQAVFIPLKLLLTVLVPIGFVFGLAVAVYQDGALNTLGLAAFHSNSPGGISWLLPASTVFLLTGLALDYDIFLYARAFELRAEGLADREAICKAVGLTGPIISCAGVIMALAFAGMLVGTNKYLNEFGFVMIVGVLLDTFVVRTILVPCVLSLGGWLNWWPRRMPRVAGEESRCSYTVTPLQGAAADVVYLGRRKQSQEEVGGSLGSI